MNRYTQDELNLHPKSEAELHDALQHFEQKWQRKLASRLDDSAVTGR